MMIFMRNYSNGRKKMKKFVESEQSGRSMVEMLGVLAIIGVLSVGGISGYSKAMAKYKINQCLDQISTLIVNIRSVFVNQTSFADATTANIIALGIPTADMLNADGTAMVNPFNGAITVVAGEDEASFKVTYSGFDKNTCQSIALADWGAAASSGLISLQINNSTAHTWGGADAALPLSIAKAATECSNDTNTNSITWEYR